MQSIWITKEQSQRTVLFTISLWAHIDLLWIERELVNLKDTTLHVQHTQPNMHNFIVNLKNQITVTKHSPAEFAANVCQDIKNS